jgi:Cys-tRNA(Pro) deacylase
MDEATRRFEDRAKRTHDLDLSIEEFPAGTETAADAADAIGCDTAQIASSLVFMADQLLVVVTSGANTVDTRKLATLRGVHTARMADPDEIEATLGYGIGGIPPFCHDESVSVYIDETLTEFETVWAAAGSPNAVFPIAPERLVACTDGTVADVVE